MSSSNTKEEDDNKPFLSQTSYVYCATVGSTSGTLDSTGHYDESPVTIFICDPPPPAPSNPNSASGASSASATSGGIDNFLYWLIPALLLLALMAGLAVYLIRRCIQGGRW
ncbi:hypothetical protein DPMN_137664 [Dreissena polymorpha]|uniref:Uncharacterized protein n=1 Tax=Dreissena polymorpha TaxID=45954 RepID=A0A9D4JJ19_DREPO|nr:hypothetical protein DPMN_137664 [Dreissena polymorpha]